mmetsp:Transcript_25589/g.61533  ORF Transcript_25589/g.61533 Transcript_25589/m.61533 type:complete len:279 (+) Transcript_25589:134-970(+)|eukprot:CAMPEP_0181080570 /NCGR_PEP_ID=MMETSP1071-20121207/2639_1 /TAXON_ID=35127 /ORGANISM="Thalassiosira sp., Strain NH16" /LENGTH=278 /DNA_ID=CAMNT_0023162059 /DNA_START=98 /DNA_END=934 /DNA_ORIENTATION=+
MTDFVAGGVAGCAGQLVGHPLDSIKTRLQSESLIAVSSKQSSAYRCALSTYREGGFRAFFRGLSLPLISKSFEQCVAFGIKTTAEGILEGMDVQEGSIRTGLSGAAAGATTAFLLTPVYLVKVQLQVTPKNGAGSLDGPMASIKHTINRFGFFGLYTGALPIFLGTSIGYAFRFATYEKATEQMEVIGFGRVCSTIVGGGMAGMATWASHYPLDLVSSRMEASVALGGRKMTMSAHFRDIYEKNGIRGFFRGLGPCLLRAFPVNAAIFLAYDLCKAVV